jgi:hypothetical protein
MVVPIIKNIIHREMQVLRKKQAYKCLNQNSDKKILIRQCLLNLVYSDIIPYIISYVGLEINFNRSMSQVYGEVMFGADTPNKIFVTDKYIALAIYGEGIKIINHRGELIGEIRDISGWDIYGILDIFIENDDIYIGFRTSKIKIFSILNSELLKEIRLSTPYERYSISSNMTITKNEIYCMNLISEPYSVNIFSKIDYALVDVIAVKFKFDNKNVINKCDNSPGINNLDEMTITDKTFLFSLYAINDKLYVLYRLENILQIINKITGKLIKQHRFKSTSRPFSLVVKDNEIIILYTDNICVYDEETGNLLRIIGYKSKDDGNFWDALAMTLHNDELYVTDNERIQVFD